MMVQKKRDAEAKAKEKAKVESEGAVPGPLQGPETITQYNERRQQELKNAIPYDPILEGYRNKLGADIAIEGIDKRLLTQADAKLDKDIGEKEQAYLDTITDKQAKLTERSAGLEDQRRQEQYLNMAKFFARLGTASPRKEGIMGLIDAGLQVAPESLDAMAATNDKIQKRKEEIEDKSSDLETLLRKEELGIVLSAAERKEKRRLQRSIDKNTERTIALEEKYKNAQIDALDIPDEIKAAYLTQIETHLDGFTSDLGAMSGLRGADGRPLVLNGKIQNQKLQSEIQSLKTLAIGQMHTLGSYAAFVNAGMLADVDREMNKLIAKYTVNPTSGPPNAEDEKPDSSQINK